MVCVTYATYAHTILPRLLHSYRGGKLLNDQGGAESPGNCSAGECVDPVGGDSTSGFVDPVGGDFRLKEGPA